MLDDISGLNPITETIPRKVFHTRNIHASNGAAKGRVILGFYDGQVAPANMRWRLYVGVATSIDITGIRSMRFHSTILVVEMTRATTCLVHIGGVLRNN